MSILPLPITITTTTKLKSVIIIAFVSSAQHIFCYITFYSWSYFYWADTVISSKMFFTLFDSTQNTYLKTNKKSKLVKYNINKMKYP